MRGLARLVVVALTAAWVVLAGLPAARADAYHAEVVACDLTGDALFVTGLANLDPHGAGATMLVASGALYLLGAPVVHVAHGDGGVALGSLGLRVGSLVPFGVGLWLAETQARRAGGYDHPDGGFATFFAGGVISVLAIVAVQIIDPVVLTPDGDPAATMPLTMPLWRGTF